MLYILLYIMCCVVHTVHCCLCAVYCVIYNVYCAFCAVYCALHSVSMLYAVCNILCFWMLYIACCIMYTLYRVIKCTVYCILNTTACRILCTVYFALYGVHCMMYSVFCALCIPSTSMPRGACLEEAAAGKLQSEEAAWRRLPRSCFGPHNPAGPVPVKT